MASQQDGGPSLCQLSHPGCTQLQDIQCVQDTSGILDANLQLRIVRSLPESSGPSSLRGAVRPPRSEAEFCQGLGPRLLQAVSGVLSLLAGDPSEPRHVVM